MILAAFGLVFAAGCSKDQADKCCTSASGCAAVGLAELAPCDTGVCFDGACVRGCDSDSDCGATPDTPVCMSGVCSCATSDTCGGNRPVCDTASHDCRACAADSDCDSGACDLLSGACADPDEVLYASTDGTATAACTSAAPCALGHAVDTLDKNHGYIVLKPGTYHAGLALADHDVVVCGGGATLDLPATGIELDGISATLRQLKITSAAGVAAGLQCDNCTVTLDHVQVTAGASATGLVGGPKIEIHHSTFDGWPFALSSTSDAKSTLSLWVDASSFTAGAFVLDGQGAARVTNSVFADLGTGNAVHIASTANKTLTVELANNTFANAAIVCEGDAGDNDAAVFTSNIFATTTLSTSADTCTYDYNLGAPAISAGPHDRVGDPKFVNAAGHDFHLAAGSPAIDASTAKAATDLDYDGLFRPLGATFDIGAYEYKP